MAGLDLVVVAEDRAAPADDVIDWTDRVADLPAACGLLLPCPPSSNDSERELADDAVRDRPGLVPVLVPAMLPLLLDLDLAGDGGVAG